MQRRCLQHIKLTTHCTKLNNYIAVCPTTYVPVSRQCMVREKEMNEMREMKRERKIN